MGPSTLGAMTIRSIKLKDERYGEQWFEEIEDRWEYADFKADPRWRHGWISMDCALYDEESDRVYLGITSFDSDIFKAYDRASETFVDLGAKAVGSSTLRAAASSATTRVPASSRASPRPCRTPTSSRSPSTGNGS